MDTGTQHRDFARSFWKLRAVFCPDVLNEETGDIEDITIWFVAGDISGDHWFAHGLTEGTIEGLPEEDVDSIVDQLFDAIDTMTMDTMLTLAGQPWEIIAPLPVQHAASQRDVLHRAVESGSIFELYTMTTGQLEAVRSEWEGTTDPSVN